MELGFTHQNEIKIIKPKPKIKKYYIQKPKKERINQCKRIYCLYCDCYYQHRIASQHKKTLKHKNNYLI